MPSIPLLEFGDISLAPFPFAGQTTGKKHPAMVISSAAYNIRTNGRMLSIREHRLRN
jgi:hypothetical protein